MSCDVASTIGEELRYIWYKDSHPVYNGKSYTIYNAGTSHGGSYRCETSNGGRSDPVRLDVSDDWLILQTPLYVYEGDDITIRCHHYPKYKGKDTKFYKDNRLIRDRGDAEYHIVNVDGNTAGTYRCVKKVNSYALYYEYEDKVPVSVEELFTTPRIKVTPDPVFKENNMTITCETSLHPHRQNTQLQVTFYREGQIVLGSGVSDIYGVYNVQLEDSGKYSCEVETTDRRVRKRSAEQVIKIEELFSHPYITVTNYLYEGDHMTLTCNTTLSPYIKSTEVQFAFYKDERTVKEFNSSDKYEVQFANLKDSGNYTCEIKTSRNSAMRRSYGSNILVKELFPPPLLTVFPETVSDGDTMTLSCDTNLSGYRQNTDLQYAFYRDGVKVQGFNSTNTYKVLFIWVEHSGTYTCEIRTSTSSVRKESQRLHIQASHGYSLLTILSVSSGLLLLIVMTFVIVYLFCKRWSSKKNPQPTTAADNENFVEDEVTYTVLNMKRKPQNNLPKDTESNTVYAEVRFNAKHQVKAPRGTCDTSADIYQNISSHKANHLRM
ncbi:Fc receptor-like protein 5 [Dendropsophus ebraccatus]|uniref:Fc receptor-like protein 5 n=1 Tax=Dendropsophus ebraccatus TaxID=150705 RepID=UPI003831E234